MTNHTRPALLGLTTVAAVILATTLTGTPTEARQHDHTAEPAAPAAQQDSAKTPGMGMMRTMMADHTAADARVKSLMDTMNAATGNPRVDAMAAVIAELVQQRTEMRTQMDEMPQKMMADMTTHGMSEQCPMMK